MTESESEGGDKDTFDQLKDVAEEQMANFAQLAAEARRLGLIPELPRELLEKLDLGGTVMDLLRLQLKHATAVFGVVGSQRRNLEKLNHLSALIAKGKSNRFQKISPSKSAGGIEMFELVLDNPVDRPQTVEVTLGTLRPLGGQEDPPAFTKKPGGEKASNDDLDWALVPDVTQLEGNEIRSVRVAIPTKGLDAGEYEVTAVVQLRPLGTFNRYLLSFTKSPAAKKPAAKNPAPAKRKTKRK